jgi:hypothetical protein
MPKVGLAWSVLALQMVLNAWGPDCFEVQGGGGDDVLYSGR